MHHCVYTEYSKFLSRDMTFQCFGHGGRLVFAFPPQNGTFHDYADFGMIDALKPFIDSGRITVICPGSVDENSWSLRDGDGRSRITLQENYYHYIVDELVPRSYELFPNDKKAIVTGCSMGAAHSAIFFFRRPDIFDTVIALSGFYRASFFFGDYMDELVYANSPADFIPNLPADHFYRDLYKSSKIIICIGQGAWEEELLASTREFDGILKAAGIDAWVDYWGYDVNHDWDWWRKQIVYFMEKVL